MEFYVAKLVDNKKQSYLKYNYIQSQIYEITLLMKVTKGS